MSLLGGEYNVAESKIMSKAGERLLRSVRNARAYARGEVTEGFVAHVPDKVVSSHGGNGPNEPLPQTETNSKPL